MPSKGPIFIEDVENPYPIRSMPFGRVCPEGAAMWHKKKNCGYGPEDFSYYSGVRAWFTCPNNKRHSFQVPIGTVFRAIQDQSANFGCGYCAGKRVADSNSLSKKFPQIAKEWYAPKNKLTPDQVTYGSSQKFWWQCDEGHIWQAVVVNRTQNDAGCLICNKGQKTDLAQYPDVLAEFDHKKNNGVDPRALAVGHKVWWRCKANKNHTWRSGYYRTDGIRCPYCRNLKGSSQNNLKKTHPALAKQWHPVKNGDLTPRDVTSSSTKRIWWKCPEGPDHEWHVKISDRIIYNTGCPYCGYRKTSITNVISTVAPKVAAEWHKTKNGKSKPNEVRCHSRTNYWWQCKVCDHVYAATPYSRIAAGTNCKKCALRQFSKIGVQARQKKAAAK